MTTPTISATEVARARQVSLLLGSHDLTSPGAVVAWMGAMQSQDLASGVWSLGVRLPGSSVAHVSAAIESGEVVRTWPMRGTIHLVPPEDVTWMLALTGSRSLSASAKRREDVGLDPASADRAVAILVDALRGGRRLTRAAALEALSAHGVRVDGQAGYHALGYAAHAGAICIGPNDGKQQTFVLLEDWAPNQRTLGRTEALAELAWRYFRSHGPTTVTDFAGWSGLTLTDSRAGVAANADRLASAEYAGEVLWMSSDIAKQLADGLPAQPTHALPGFDEFVLGYKDRRVQIAPEDFEAIVPGGNGVFRSTICMDGRAVATWTRTIRHDRVDVDVISFEPLSKRRTAEATAALERYAQFLGLPLRLSAPR